MDKRKMLEAILVNMDLGANRKESADRIMEIFEAPSCQHQWGEIEKYEDSICAEKIFTTYFQKCKKCGEIKIIQEFTW